MTYLCKYFRRLEDREQLERGKFDTQIPPLEVPFLAGKTAYDVGIAWWLAQCSSLAYENKITVVTELKDVGFDRIFLFDTKGTQAFLASHPGVNGSGKFAVLAFRGTEQDSIDILTDINFVKRLFPDENLLENTGLQKESAEKLPNLYAHGGFVEGIENIWGTAVRKEIEDLYNEPNVGIEWLGAPGVSNALLDLYKQSSDIALYLTGHSLGGALATLAAYKLLVYEQSFHVTALYTFGSPRTVQQPLAKGINKKFEGRSHRVVNYIDTVPRLPPRIPVLLDFRHINELVYFPGDRHRKKQATENAVKGFLGDTVIGFLGDTIVLLILMFEFLLSQATRLICIVPALVGIQVEPYVPRTLEEHKISEYIRDLEVDLSV
ncbi:lipase family protein [Leptolyngbya sp. FACHB-17]|uniref:lipase family protein n=1 Tax=unclassified Leptolyngbya TaxID=2650499 RepID=UPI00168069EE|nr:lipase family protein [Leptolyngbya sp. FACHB-17]MBD2081577.1 lipase family protein [Leptolyngbya sp. FACHB-17]